MEDLPFPDNLQYTPEDCRRCEVICEYAAQQGDKTLCVSSNATILFVSLLGMFYLLWKLIVYYKHDPRWFNMKKLILQEGILFLFLRSVRYALMLAKVPFSGKGGLIIDQLLYYCALSAILLMYCWLLVFWAQMCNKSKMPMSWLGTRMKLILTAANLLAFFFLTAVAVTVVYDIEVAQYFTLVIAAISLALSVSYTIEGSKVYHLIKSLRTLDNNQKESRDSKLTAAQADSTSELLRFL
eukprot:TRINITY_DN10810_c0_g1_i1.p1 TRINITY_DN10810_c0_g1~~TRINITY_DN10810_c0_g1_i1.p1  ORF type:complete len:255 (+),score=13.57 TRINITY_DN10810_c0_g1_i1:47-766(+)